MTRSVRHRLAPVRALVVLATLALVIFSSLALESGIAAAASRPVRFGATGTHRYRLVLLMAGERPVLPRATLDSMQAGHLANIRAMFEGGALDAAGPMGDESALVGLFFFHDEHVDLDSLLAPDPILAAGRLRAVAHTWIAPDGLGDAYRHAGKMQPGRDSMVTFSFVMLRRGPRWTANAVPGLPRLLDAQAKMIARWNQEGVLRMAGPIEGVGDLRGVYLFDADSASTAARVARDPAVKAGRLVAEIHPWWTAYGVVPGP